MMLPLMVLLLFPLPLLLLLQVLVLLQGSGNAKKEIPSIKKTRIAEKNTSFVDMKTRHEQETLNSSRSVNVGVRTGSGSFRTRFPTLHASSLGLSNAFKAYEACVRLCIHAWAKGCMEAPYFLENECALLRSTFGVQHMLLPSKEERSSGVGSEGASPKQKKMVGKMKVQVCKIKMSPPKLKIGTVPSESYLCQLRLKSSAEGDTIRMQAGSGETHIFFPDSLLDDLIIEVQDSKGNHYGCVLAEVATISKVQNDKPRWWSVYREPKHKVGKVQLYINYTTSLDENGLKCGSIAETMLYDLAMEAAMKKQNFQKRNLKLHDPWKWLLTEFASFYGVSEAYTKLSYLSYIMDVATPTNDCLSLVYKLLSPVKMKGNPKSTLNHQENVMLREIEDKIEPILADVFENYKMLDESSPSGMMDVFRPATGVAAPVLKPAVKLYRLLHDKSPEAQNKLCSYLQAAAKKRLRRHLTDKGEENLMLMDDVTVCLNIMNEIRTDTEIDNRKILPSSINLPNLSSAIYIPELRSRLRSFLSTCPSARRSGRVTELVIATADFQKDLATWNINAVEGGVDAKELFHRYIIKWIQDEHLSLLEKVRKVKWSGVRMQRSTVDQMYAHLKDTLNDYYPIISRWPEYTFYLKNAIVDFGKAMSDALDTQYADVLKEILAPKKSGVKYVKKLTKGTLNPYVVPSEIGILLNSMKQMLDVLCPEIEDQLRKGGSCILNEGSTAAGERLSDVVSLSIKFENYRQAVVEKLYENTRLQNRTKLKKILQDSKESLAESEIRRRMQPLTEQLTSTVNHLRAIFETRVFIEICQGYWDRMGLDVLSFLKNLKEKKSSNKNRVAVSDVSSFPKNGKENKSLYKGARVAISILDFTFGDALEEKDLKPPQSIIDIKSMLFQDTRSSSHKKNSWTCT